MRVATIFTGIATCAVGFTPMANAQDTAHPNARHVSKRAGRAVPAGQAYGSIRYNSDCANRGIDKNWLHVSTHTGSPILPYESYCFGHEGLYSNPPGIGIVYQCGGNNHGILYGTTTAGRKWSATYGPGTTWRKISHAHLTGVYINSWTGHDACGKGPYAYE